MSIAVVKQVETGVAFPHPIDPELDRRVRRCFGEKAGKRVPATCKNCTWFKKALPGNTKACEVEYAFAKNEKQNLPVPEEFLCENYAHKEHEATFITLGEQSLSTLKIWQKLLPSISNLIDSYGKELLTQSFSSLMKLNQMSLPTVGEWVSVYVKNAPGIDSANLPPLKSEWAIKDRKTGKTFEAIVWRATKHMVTLLPDRQYKKTYGEEYAVDSALFYQIATSLVSPDEEEEVSE